MPERDVNSPVNTRNTTSIVLICRFRLELDPILAVSVTVQAVQSSTRECRSLSFAPPARRRTKKKPQFRVQRPWSWGPEPEE